MSRVGGVSGEKGGCVDVTGDPRWNVFVSSLKKKGYFQVSFVVKLFNYYSLPPRELGKHAHVLLGRVGRIKAVQPVTGNSKRLLSEQHRES